MKSHLLLATHWYRYRWAPSTKSTPGIYCIVQRNVPRVQMPWFSSHPLTNTNTEIQINRREEKGFDHTAQEIWKSYAHPAESESTQFIPSQIFQTCEHSLCCMLTYFPICLGKVDPILGEKRDQFRWCLPDPSLYFSLCVLSKFELYGILPLIQKFYVLCNLWIEPWSGGISSGKVDTKEGFLALPESGFPFDILLWIGCGKGRKGQEKFWFTYLTQPANTI